ncbi:MAG: biotin carboxylase N-terminal domain-containing protein [Pirellulales bacterium]
MLGREPIRAYLNIPNIIEIVLQHGVDAIHPGYGFLSGESRACEGFFAVKQASSFVGPHERCRAPW